MFKAIATFFQLSPKATDLYVANDPAPGAYAARQRDMALAAALMSTTPHMSAQVSARIAPPARGDNRG